MRDGGNHSLNGLATYTTLLMILLLLSGCSGHREPARYDVSGTVTYAGKSVPNGKILFEPDKAKGNRGPSGFATIKEGKYDTSLDGKGTIGGPHVVRIVGFDGVPSGQSMEGKPLFHDYQANADLPAEKTTKDFQVPAQNKGKTSTPVHGRSVFGTSPWQFGMLVATNYNSILEDCPPERSAIA
jgi:hypothetical protein